MTARNLSFATAACLLLTMAQVSQAGEITGFSWFSGVASVAGTTVNPPVVAGNDNVVGTSPNEFFLTQKNYTGIGPVDLSFVVVDSPSGVGPVTEYRFREGVQNSTGLDWTGYHLELGFGTGVSFVKSGPGDGLDFDSPDFDSDLDFNPGPGFTTVTATEDDIYATDGVQPNGSFAGYYVFHVDVPNGISQFTVRQSPIPVPEPASVALLGCAGLLLGTRRRSV